MKKIGLILFQALIILWIIFAIGYYFYQFKKLNDPNCNIVNACIKIKNQSWQLTFAQNRQDYVDTFKSIFTVNDNMFSPFLYIFLFGVLFFFGLSINI